MAGFLERLFGSREPDPGPDPRPGPAAPPEPTDGAAAEVTALAARLSEIVAMVNRNGGRMPEGGVPGVHAVGDALQPLLAYLGTHPPTEEELIPVRATVTDYLPTTLAAFLALPTAFANTHRGSNGRTPAAELVDQLRLLHDGVLAYADSIYAGDAMRLSNQGRFLQAKFGRSELDL